MKSEESKKSALSKTYNDPLDFLLAVMNDETIEAGTRLDAATALMPYFHESLCDPEGDAAEE